MFKPQPTLRFAALIRVSTERQKDKGESLRTQDQQLGQAVKQSNGMIAVRYAGQEHATAGRERELVQKLLADAAKTPKPFDAVIVTDPSRWSRDNVASETGLDLLRDSHIRFFVLAQEFDLFDPNARIFLTMQTAMNGYQASLQKQKSLVNRILRAGRLGAPTCGKRPFGRDWDKDRQAWAVNSEMQAMIQDVAKRYLAGEPLARLALEYGQNHSNLHKTLMHRCGGVWEQTFTCKGLNIKETVLTKVPSLLPEATIKALRHQAQANKTYQRGQPKHKYLFGRLVFCDQCGHAMSGQTNHNGHRYYRHSSKNKCVKDGPKAWVNAEVLEEVAIRHLFQCFGNPKAVQKAIEEATPNKDKIKVLRQRHTRIEASLKEIEAARNRILGLITKNLITEDHAVKQLTELNQKEAGQQEEIQRLQNSLENIASPESIEEMSGLVAGKFRRYSDPVLRAKIKHADHHLDEMTWDERRALAQMVFSGKTADGKRMGIYIEGIDGQNERRRKQWKYTIRGHFIRDWGQLPMSQSLMAAYFTFGAATRRVDLVTRCASH